MRLGTAHPTVLKDLLSFKFPSSNYYPRRSPFVPSPPPLGKSSPQLARATATTQPDKQVGPSGLLCPKLRRFPGESLPQFPFTLAICDPSLIDRVVQGFKNGSELRSASGLDQRLPPTVSECLKRFSLERIRFKVMGDTGSLHHLMELLEEAVVPTVSALVGKEMLIRPHDAQMHGHLGQPGDVQLALEPRTEPTNRSADTKITPPKFWLDFASHEPVDIRILRDGRLKERLEGDAYMILALQLGYTRSRFGLFYCAPYFVLAERVVENGRSHMLISPLYTSAWVAPDDGGPAAADGHKFLAALVSLLTCYRPKYAIQGPSQIGEPDETASIPFVQVGKTAVSMRHRPDQKIICGVDGDPASDLLAIAVELHCSEASLLLNTRFFPDALRQEEASESVLRVESIVTAGSLDRLELVTELGGGRTSMVWSARWSRVEDDATSDLPTSTSSDDEADSFLVAKIVSGEYASSVAREYFVHTRIVPLLSPAARAFIPKFHGLYRSESDGSAYILVFDHAGEVIPEAEWEADEELESETMAAFQLVADEGLVHADERRPNVVRRGNGQIFLVDWGEASVDLARLRRPDLQKNSS
ncbi:BQ5605_C004g02759 [Microbotryum silenes-dioicae]|uniref:BQ5605_C004g02759 protein n=1 Tax=Microbotryum silenes-dioicae TaxID=796604 RepID=A0A2X0MBZ9_9BASI|nr:BQ5605_C004g02759 [Microbotryum silenes-dioicae]